MNDYRTDRRGLFGAGVALAGVGLATGTRAAAQGATAAADPQDAWMDKAGARHRLVLDTTEASAAGPAAAYAMNFIHANETGYGLKPADLGVILILRHMSTPYAYGDATWKKYGRMFAKVLDLKGDEAIQAVSGNPMLAKDDKPVPKGLEWAGGPPLANLIGKGVMFGVCAMATEGIAQQLAKGTGGDAKSIEAGLKADLIANAHMVPAGIVAVGRAQERGYAFAYVA